MEVDIRDSRSLPNGQRVEIAVSENEWDVSLYLEGPHGTDWSRYTFDDEKTARLVYDGTTDEQSFERLSEEHRGR